MLLRLATAEDAEQILAVYAPYVLNTCISFETAVPAQEEMKERIEDTLKHNPWVVIEEEADILGYAYASKHRERAAYRWSVDISIYVRQDCRGKGMGKALYTALIEILKLQGYYNVYAGICLPNEASVGVHEYFGLKKIAHYSKVGYKFGKWHDTGWWELTIKEHETEPKEPILINYIETEVLTRIFSEALK